MRKSKTVTPWNIWGQGGWNFIASPNFPQPSPTWSRCIYYTSTGFVDSTIPSVSVRDEVSTVMKEVIDWAEMWSISPTPVVMILYQEHQCFRVNRNYWLNQKLCWRRKKEWGIAREREGRVGEKERRGEGERGWGKEGEKEKERGERERERKGWERERKRERGERKIIP